MSTPSSSASAHVGESPIEPYGLDPADTVARIEAFRSTYPRHTCLLGEHQWSYRRTGVGPHALVLLPSSYGGADAFFDVARLLPTDVNVIVIDPPYMLPVQGVSSALAECFSRLGVVKAYVAGVGIGAYLTQLLCVSRPQAIAGAMFVNSVGGRVAGLDAQAGTTHAFDAEVLLAHDRMAVGSEASEDPGDVATARVLAYLMGTSQSALDYARARAFSATAPRLPAALTPHRQVTLVRCADDYEVSASANEDLRRSHPLANHIALEAGGHHLHINRPLVLAQLLAAGWANAIWS